MDNNTYKICTKCKISKKTSLFNKSSRNLSGLYSSCKECQKQFREENKEKINQQRSIYRKENKDKIRESAKKHYINNREKRIKQNKQWALDNIEKLTQYKKDYYQENKEYLTNKNRTYFNKNKDQLLIQQKEYYNKNKKNILEKSKEYRIKNKDKIRKRMIDYSKTVSHKISKRTSNHLRNTKIRATNDKTINKLSLIELMNRQNNKCYYCNTDLDITKKFSVHLDHFIPINKGGTHSINNVVWSCKKCNLSKHSKYPDRLLLL